MEERAVADEMLSISRALSERDAELRARARKLSAALPELKREAEAYGDELSTRCQVHYELLLGKVDELLGTVQTEVREEALLRRGASARVATLEAENAALRAQTAELSQSLARASEATERDRQRLALARQRQKAARVANESLQRQLKLAAAEALTKAEAQGVEMRQLRRRLVKLRAEHRAENQQLQQQEAATAAADAAAAAAVRQASAASRQARAAKARPRAAAARGEDAIGRAAPGGAPELLALVESLVEQRRSSSSASSGEQLKRGGGNGTAAAAVAAAAAAAATDESSLLPGARVLLLASEVPPRLQCLLIEMCLDLIAAALRRAAAASGGGAHRAPRLALQQFDEIAERLMRSRDADVRLRAAMLALSLDGCRVFDRTGGALAPRLRDEAVALALETHLTSLQANAAVAFALTQECAPGSAAMASAGSGSGGSAGGVPTVPATRGERRGGRARSPMAAIVRWSAPYILRLVLSAGTSADRSAPRKAQRATAVRVLVSLLCDGGSFKRNNKNAPRAPLLLPAPRDLQSAPPHTHPLSLARVRSLSSLALPSLSRSPHIAAGAALPPTL